MMTKDNNRSSKNNNNNSNKNKDNTINTITAMIKMIGSSLMKSTVIWMKAKLWINLDGFSQIFWSNFCRPINALKNSLCYKKLEGKPYEMACCMSYHSVWGEWSLKNFEKKINRKS